jgi:sarcosine oxidase subunit alpha
MPASATPIARSPLHSWHAAHGALFTERHGWQVVARFRSAEAEVQAARAGIGVADVSASIKVSLQGPGVSDLAQALVPDGSAAETHGVGVLPGGRAFACRLTDEHLLLIAMTTEARDLAPRETQGVVVSDVTSAHAGFVVVGPQTEALLRRLTHLDVRPAALPVNSCVETALAGVEALLIRTTESALPSLRIYVAWDMAEYVWERLIEAGREWQVTPLGLEALNRLVAGAK